MKKKIDRFCTTKFFCDHTLIKKKVSYFTVDTKSFLSSSCLRKSTTVPSGMSLCAEALNGLTLRVASILEQHILAQL
jgi:hypothetical protein